MAFAEWNAIFIFLFLFISLTNSQNASTTLPTPSSSRAPTNPPQTPQGIRKNTDIGTCVCNLIKNKCDINCCCDEDCTDFDREAFSGCIDLPSRYDGKSCTKEYFIFKSNTGNYKTETVGDFFCVYKDNYEERNYYTQPDLLRTEDDFKKRLSTIKRYTFKRGEENLQLDKINRYKSGSLILITSNSSVISYLSQPSPSHNQECLNRNPAEFLVDKTFSCNRKIINFEEDCTGIKGLNAQYYYKNFEVLISPRITSNIQDSSLPIDLINCNKSNNVSECSNGDILEPQLSFSSGNWTCKNVVESVTFNVYHKSDKNSTTIERVKMEVKLKTITKGVDVSVGQTHTFEYLESRRESIEKDIFIKSGNPGYLRGRPILAGKLKDESQPDGTTKPIIELSKDRNNWLTVLASLPDGSCGITSNRVPVNFGENIRTGCLFKATKDQLNKECSFIQDSIIQALIGENATINGLQDLQRYVATFGNSSQTVTADWMQVAVINRPSGPVEQSKPGVCSGVVTSVHLQIAYANVGSLNNPQSRIVGVAYRFPQETTSIKYQCIGLYCQPGTQDLSQKFEITSSVEFIDISEKAEGVVAATPKLKQRLPEDFFYPFL